MSSSTALPSRPSRPSLAFDCLPDEAQSLICSLVSTPSRPAHLLLALVCKRWRAEAARHLRMDGASIEFELSCDTYRPVEELEREVERLEGLAAWLQQYGHLLNQLKIKDLEPEPYEEEPRMQETAQAVPLILSALTAAGRQRGGLRLQQLRLPVFGSTPMFTICRALSGCGQLQELCLENSFSGQTTQASEAALGMLPAALGQLTQLTSLSLGGDLFHCYYPQQPVDANNLVSSLPRSLVSLCFGIAASNDMRAVNLHTTSLQHLVALRKLWLPESTTVSTDSDDSSSDDNSCSGNSSSSSGGGSSSSSSDHGDSQSIQHPSSRSCNGSSHHSLSQLTALTFMSCRSALQQQGEALLALPNLVQLSAGAAMPDHLEGLAGRTALRYLSCTLSPCCFAAQGAALAQLTQLIGLTVRCYGVDDDVLRDAQEWPPHGFEDAESLLAAAGDEWGTAVSALTGLRKLRAEPMLLLEVDLDALTCLTSLGIDYTNSDWFLEDEDLVQELSDQLEELPSRVREVVLHGVTEMNAGVCCYHVERAMHRDVQIVLC